MKSHTSQLAAAALLAGFWCTSAAAPVSEPERNGAKIAALREVLDKWVDMQKALAKEKSEAKQAAQLLEQRIELLSHEVEDLQKKKTESEKGITEADVKKAEMVTKKEAAIQSLEALAGEMPKMEVELRALQPRLPDPLKEKLSKLFERMPEAGKETKVTLAERCQNVVGILNEVNKAGQEISLVDETRTLNDGKPSAVKTLYVGLAQAYFVNTTGKMAGVGRPGPNGWVWKQDDSMAGAVRGAIGMLQSKSAAKFVGVPLQID